MSGALFFLIPMIAFAIIYPCCQINDWAKWYAEEMERLNDEWKSEYGQN